MSVVACHFTIRVDLCNYHTPIGTLLSPQRFPLPLIFMSHPPLPSPAPPCIQHLTMSNLFSMSLVLSFWEYYINGIILYMIFWDWHFSLSIIPQTSLQAVCFHSWFSFTAENYCAAWMYHSLFNYLLIKKHFCCFQFLAIVNKSADKYSWTVLHNKYYCANIHFDFFGRMY